MRNLLRKIELNLRFLFNRSREKNILARICKGKGADIGCGSNKICESAIGVDLTAKGQAGKFGNQKNQISQADIQSQGDKLPFKNNELDYLVAKHNLEHYKNPLATLKEWKRVVRQNGKIGVIVPDDDYVDSRKLDSTHYYDFNMRNLELLFKKAGLRILDKGQAIKHWSIFLIAEKLSG